MNAFRPAPWLLLPLFIAACGKKETPPPAPTPADSGNPSEQAADSAAAWQQARTLAWERSAHHAVLEEWPQARAAMAPVASDPRAEAADLVRAATIELQAGMPGQAEVLLDRAKAQGPELPAALWLRARLATNSLDQLPQARTLLEELNQQQPADLATRYALARIYEDLEPDSDAEWDANQKRAQDLYRSIFEQGLANGTVWYVSSLYRLYVLSLEDPDPAVTQQYEALWNGVQSIGAKAASVAQLNEGELARLLPPAAGGHRARAVGRMPAWKRLQRLEAPVGGAHNLVARDLDGDHLADLFWLDQEGLLVWRQVQEGTFEAQRVATGAIDGVLAGDLSRDGVLDFLVVRGGDLTLLDGSAGEDGALHYSEVPQQVTLPLAPKDLCWLDYDHDGDLDVLAVGDFGLRMLRNDGAGKIPERGPDQARGGFSDVTESLGVTAGGALTWCAAEDFDRDQDVDFLVGGPGRTLLASSLRSGRFADVTKETLGSDRPDGNRPNLADFDGDGVVDLLYRDATGFTLRFGGPGARKQQLLASPSTDAVCGDLDLDGQLDALWGELPRMGAGFLAVGADVRKPHQLPASPGTTESLLLAELDRSFDGPLQLELLRLTATGVEIWHDPTPAGHGLRVRFQGRKDNADGIGAVVEVRADGGYGRRFLRGPVELFGLGQADYADVVRVTWPNGVRQSNLDVEAGDPFALDEGMGQQSEGLIGSCPFLYSWNGERYEFISDVLGITPLGLPMAPGMLVPPDHDEYVLIRGEQLAPKDGVYELQFTEELREVTYLDRAQLLVVDHPEGTELQPNERFCFPPFPGPEPHLFDTPLAPKRATGSDGQDWTAALAAIDDVHAAPATALRGQFLGLSEPHWIELEFDAARTQGADSLRLVCTGWFYWTDASVNMATAYTPDLDFTPPIFLVPQNGPDGEQWVPIGPPVGFPAGKTKTMVIDVTGMIDASRPRLRILSSLTLYWDALRLAVGDRGGEQRVTKIEASSAHLWQRGFSAPILSADATLPERFDWQVLSAMPRWDQHPGLYTRFGECLPLVQAIDDRFVILGSGDALTLRFDAGQAPPLAPGMRRDYLLFLDGWAKDRDPNTIDALTVEPLPFHGMGSYPYGEDKEFPSGEVHERWRREWNTRPARQAVAPLAQADLEAWLRQAPLPRIENARHQK